MSDSQQNHPTPKQIQPRVKVWLETVGQATDDSGSGGQYVFGLGISQILKAIDSSGSIKAAAEKLGKSYRHIWSRVKEAEEALGQPLVDARVGGSGSSRSSLTDLARRLVGDYDALRRRMFEIVEEEFSVRFKELSRPDGPACRGGAEQPEKQDPVS
ncbi:MAG: LysR family transcriptional regulator [Pirellulales bacterium]|nr:LysR family transcriptional regulator [Pirellulales bacterium]